MKDAPPSTGATLADETATVATATLAGAVRRALGTAAVVLLAASAIVAGSRYVWDSYRYPLMRLAAWIWVVNDPVEQGDVVVVLAGGADSRPLTAAELYKGGYAPVVLVADPAPGAAAAENRPAGPDGQLAVDCLTEMGVPQSAIVRFGGDATSTRDEAYGVRGWLEQHAARRVIVPTDPFHTRRVRFVFEHVLRGMPAKVIVIAIPNKRYDPLQWWKSEEATQIFRRELAKVLFYVLTSPLATIA